MKNHTRTVLVLALAAPAVGQTSPYFVSAGDQQRISVIQAGAISNQWQTPNLEYPIAVAGDVRTTGFIAGNEGRIYDYAGNIIGGPLAHNIDDPFYDSTTDGQQHNFLVEFNSGIVYRTDRDFQNEQQLFQAQLTNPLGITYDPYAGTIWLSEWNGSRVRQYDLAGNPISEFSTGHDFNAALAFDPADSTLWLHDDNQRGTFEQYDLAGNLLFRGAIPNMQSQFVLGGEFNIPTPATAPLLLLLTLANRRRRPAC